jgi:hypothetical protein
MYLEQQHSLYSADKKSSGEIRGGTPNIPKLLLQQKKR